MKLYTALKVTAATVVVVAVVGLVGQQILHPTVARAQSGCLASTVTGPYSYSVTGTYYDSLGYVYAYADMGVLTADGNGSVTGSDTVSNDGTVGQRTFTGTYTVNPNCTENVKLQFSSSSSASMDFAIFNGGKGINLIETDGGVIVAGTATAQ